MGTENSLMLNNDKGPHCSTLLYFYHLLKEENVHTLFNKAIIYQKNAKASEMITMA